MEKALRNSLRNGCFASVPRTRSNTMRLIKSRGNKSTEQRFRLALVRNGIRGWTINQNVLGTRPDFYLVASKCAVFLDGCFWHGCPLCGHIPKTRRKFWKTKIQKNKERDQRNNAILTQHGIGVLRFWEHEVASDLNRCLELVVKR